MPYQFKNSWEIEGIDSPLIDPATIPVGMVQDWDKVGKKYRLIWSGNKQR